MQIQNISYKIEVDELRPITAVAVAQLSENLFLPAPDLKFEQPGLSTGIQMLNLLSCAETNIESSYIR